MRRSLKARLDVTVSTTKLVVICVECHAVAKTTLGEHQEIVPKVLYREHGWVLSILTPPGTEPVEFGPLCKQCTKNIYPDDVAAFLADETKGGDA